MRWGGREPIRGTVPVHSIWKASPYLFGCVILQHLADEEDGPTLVIGHVLQGQEQDLLRQVLLLILNTHNKQHSTDRNPRPPKDNKLQNWLTFFYKNYWCGSYF